MRMAGFGIRRNRNGVVPSPIDEEALLQRPSRNEKWLWRPSLAKLAVLIALPGGKRRTASEPGSHMSGSSMQAVMCRCQLSRSGSQHLGETLTISTNPARARRNSVA